jgi:hypothetical protein
LTAKSCEKIPGVTINIELWVFVEEKCETTERKHVRTHFPI